MSFFGFLAQHITARLSPSNYTNTDTSVEGHLEGLDTAVGTALSPPAFNDLTDVDVAQTLDGVIAHYDLTDDEWHDDVLVTAQQIAANSSTGAFKGGVMSVNGGDNTKFDISQTHFQVVDNFTDPDDPVLTHVVVPAQTALSVTNIATTPRTMVGWRVDNVAPAGGASSAITATVNGASGTIYLIENPEVFTEEEEREIVSLGLLVHPSTSIDTPIVAINPAWSPAHQLHDLINVLGILNKEGNVYFANVSANLEIDKTAGSTHRLGINNDDTVAGRKRPNISDDAALTTAAFRYRYQDGSGGITETGSDITDIDSAQYDDGSGSLATIGGGPNQWTIQTLWMFSPNNATRIMYGQALYTSLADARSGASDSIVSDPNLINNANFRGWLLVKKGATDLTDADNEFIDAGKFNTIGGSGAAAGLFNIVEDLTPEHGGPLVGGGFPSTNMGPISIVEQAAANADIAGEVQLWAKTATPNQLWFTDDAGTDTQLGVGGGDFDTIAAVEAADIGAATNRIIVLGYTAAGDEGGGIYRRSASEPSHEGKIQSNDGAWWELDPSTPASPLQFGAVRDDSTDDLSALDDFIAYLFVTKAEGWVPEGTYKITDAWFIENQSGVRIKFHPESWIKLYSTSGGAGQVIGIKGTAPATTEVPSSVTFIEDIVLDGIGVTVDATNLTNNNGIGVSFAKNVHIANPRGDKIGRKFITFQYFCENVHAYTGWCDETQQETSPSTSAVTIEGVQAGFNFPGPVAAWDMDGDDMINCSIRHIRVVTAGHSGATLSNVSQSNLIDNVTFGSVLDRLTIFNEFALGEISNVHCETEVPDNLIFATADADGRAINITAPSVDGDSGIEISSAIYIEGAEWDHVGTSQVPINLVAGDGAILSNINLLGAAFVGNVITAASACDNYTLQNSRINCQGGATRILNDGGTSIGGKILNNNFIDDGVATGLQMNGDFWVIMGNTFENDASLRIRPLGEKGVATANILTGGASASIQNSIGTGTLVYGNAGDANTLNNLP